MKNIKQVISVCLVILIFCTTMAVTASAYSVNEYTPYGNNCVLYVQSKIPNVPYGLTSFSNKKNIINSYTPAAGSVAIIDSGNSYGHVAIVTNVSNGWITIRETNWGFNGVNERSGYASSLKIVGYFKPYSEIRTSTTSQALYNNAN